MQVSKCFFFLFFPGKSTYSESAPPSLHWTHYRNMNCLYCEEEEEDVDLTKTREVPWNNKLWHLMSSKKSFCKTTNNYYNFGYNNFMKFAFNRCYDPTDPGYQYGDVEGTSKCLISHISRTENGYLFLFLRRNSLHLKKCQDEFFLSNHSKFHWRIRRLRSLARIRRMVNLLNSVLLFPINFIKFVF